jgi:hypothetical protein
MPTRSQRHLREFYGQDSAGDGDSGTAPTPPNPEQPVITGYYGVWEKTQGAGANNANANPITAGCKFTVLAAGFIYGIRWYRSTSSEALTGALWSASATPLAQKTLAAGTTGWVDIIFTTPIAVTTGTQYTAGVLTPNHYPSLPNVNPHTVGDIAVSVSCFDDTDTLTKPATVFAGPTDYYVTPLFSRIGTEIGPMVRADLYNWAPVAHGSDLLVADTGARPGTVFANWPAGTPLYSQCAGHIIEGYHVTDQIVIQHDNVTVRNCFVESGSPDYGIHPDGDGTPRTGYDIRFNTVTSTVATGGSYGIGIPQGVCYRNHITKYENHLSLTGNDLDIVENWCDQTGTNPGGHNDTLECNGGARIRILRNRLIETQDNTTALLVNSKFAAVNNVVIDKNHIASNSNYTVQLTADPAFTFDAASITFTNNLVVAGTTGPYNVSAGVVTGPSNTVLPHSAFPG